MVVDGRDLNAIQSRNNLSNIIVWLFLGYPELIQLRECYLIIKGKIGNGMVHHPDCGPGLHYYYVRLFLPSVFLSVFGVGSVIPE